MDLGLKGKTAVISGGSKGLGRAVAEALAKEGVNVFLVARGAKALEQTATAIEATFGVSATPVVADVSTEAGRKAILAASPSPDILLTNAGCPAPGDFRTWTHEMWLQALETNMLAPIELIRMFIDGMVERKFGRIVNITANGVKSPPPGFGLSVSPRLGLTGFVAGVAREVARANVTLNSVLPARQKQKGSRPLRSILQKPRASLSRSGKLARSSRFLQPALLPLTRSVRSVPFFAAQTPASSQVRIS